MTATIKRFAGQIGAGRFFLLWGLSLLAGMLRRTGGPQTAPLHLLAVLSDQYYFTFSVLPAFLFLCSGAMEDDPDIVILRFGSYGRCFLAKWRGLCFLCAGAWMVQLAVIALTGLGLPQSGGWGTAMDHGIYRDIFATLAEHFSTPWMALVCTALHLLAGYWLASLLILWLGHFLPRSNAIKALMALYVLAVFWVKLPVMAQPPFRWLTGLNHWMLLLHNLTEPWRFKLTLAVTLPLVGGMLWSVRRRWRKTPQGRPRPARSSRHG